MMRHTDMVMIIMKEGVYTHQSLETGIARHAGPHVEAPAEAKQQRDQEKTWARAFIVVSMWGKRARQGKQDGDWLVNNFRAVWALSLIVWSWPWVIRVEGQWP